MGAVASRQMRGGNLYLKISAADVTGDMHPGDSIAVNGVCLTVTAVEPDGFRAEASAHTLSRSTLGGWLVGKRVNLERAVRVGDRLGGHIVQGHVDGAGRVSRIRYGEGSTDIQIDVPAALLRLMAPSGSVAVDGVSLTIAGKSARGFRVMVIPYTLEHTIIKDLRPGDAVNIETDLTIRWLADRFPEGEVVAGPEIWEAGEGQFHLED